MLLIYLQAQLELPHEPEQPELHEQEELEPQQQAHESGLEQQPDELTISAIIL